MGASGVGKTTLGRLVAQAQEKISGLMVAVTAQERFVLSGSMSSFHTEFDPFFDFAVFLRADTETRLLRVQRRAEERFGSRVLIGRDIFENHRKMMDNTACYDMDGSPNLTEQRA